MLIKPTKCITVPTSCILIPVPLSGVTMMVRPAALDEFLLSLPPARRTFLAAAAASGS